MALDNWLPTTDDSWNQQLDVLNFVVGRALHSGVIEIWYPCRRQESMYRYRKFWSSDNTRFALTRISKSLANLSEKSQLYFKNNSKWPASVYSRPHSGKYRVYTVLHRRFLLAALQHDQAKSFEANTIKCSTQRNIPSERAWTAATHRLSTISYTVFSKKDNCWNVMRG